MVELKLKKVSKKYYLGQKKVDVLENITFSVRKREAIALVGPSGCGKTTLIRLIASLETTTSGSITCQGKLINGPSNKTMMVFEQFALLPWKTVLENVEMALLGKESKERKELAMKCIDLVGLDGSEDSYPRELSAGMKQRVGLARAICREPEILLLDEAFSSLDPLTANNLRNEVLKIFYSRKTKPHVLILVTNNMEEAVYMAERVLVMSKRPSKIVADIKIDLPHPPNLRSKKFMDYVDQITSLIS